MTKKQVLTADISGHLGQLLKPSPQTYTTQFESLINTALDLADTLSEYLKPGRKRAAVMHAKNIGEYANNLFIMYHVPEGRETPVWRAFVNPSYEAAQDAQITDDLNWCYDFDGVRTKIQRPDQIVLRADMVFDLDLSSRDVVHDSVRHNYEEILFQKTIPSEGFSLNSVPNGNAFLPQMMCDLSRGILTVDYTPKEELAGFIENSGTVHRQDQTIFTTGDFNMRIYGVAEKDLGGAPLKITQATADALRKFTALRQGEFKLNPHSLGGEKLRL